MHTKPSTGKNFYRIHAIENNKDVFTATKQINFDKENRLLIYPNPAKSGSQITIELPGNPGGTAMTIELFSMNGQKKTVYLIASGSNSISISLPALPAGQYIVKLIRNKTEVYMGNVAVIK